MGVDVMFVFVLQAEDGIRDLVRSRGLGDVYKRQGLGTAHRNEIGLISGLCRTDQDSLPVRYQHLRRRRRPLVAATEHRDPVPLRLQPLRQQNHHRGFPRSADGQVSDTHHSPCLLYTSAAADERSRVNLGGRRIIQNKKKKQQQQKRR
mgnify:CR=1 FL=1